MIERVSFLDRTMTREDVAIIQERRMSQQQQPPPQPQQQGEYQIIVAHVE